MTATQKSAAVWFLFGLSGAGKSYVGDVISQQTGWPVYHADIDITAEMKLALTEARPFTDSMRDEYFSQLLEHIKDRQQSDLPLIVTQGAYKQKHRDFLRKHLPQLTFVWVDAPLDMIIKRLEQHVFALQLPAMLIQKNLQVFPLLLHVLYTYVCIYIIYILYIHIYIYIYIYIHTYIIY